MLDESTGKYQGYFDYILNWVTPNIKSTKLDKALKAVLYDVYNNVLSVYDENLFKLANTKGIFQKRKAIRMFIIGFLGLKSRGLILHI